MPPVIPRAASLGFLLATVAGAPLGPSIAQQTYGGIGQRSCGATAQTGGLAIAGSVAFSTLNAYSRDPADVQQIARLLADRDTAAVARHEAELRAEKLAGEVRTTKQQMLLFLSILAEQDVSPEQVPATMAEITRNYQRQQASYAALAPQNLQASDLVRQAKQATDDGHFSEADRLLKRAIDHEPVAGTEQQTKVAAIAAARGDNAATQLHYQDAAMHYEAAAALLPASASDIRAKYLVHAADALESEGGDRGDNTALSRSIELYKDAVDIYAHERMTLDLGKTQDGLGLALWKLGERETGTAHLEEAISVLRGPWR